MRGDYLCNNNVAVQTSVEALRVSLHTHLKRKKHHIFTWITSPDNTKNEPEAAQYSASSYWAWSRTTTREKSIKIKRENMWGEESTTYETVLLPVVQPVAGPTRADDSLELVGFHPDDFIHSVIAERKATNSIKWCPNECNILMAVDAEKEKTYPHRLRHSLPSSMALQDEKLSRWRVWADKTVCELYVRTMF